MKHPIFPLVSALVFAASIHGTVLATTPASPSPSPAASASAAPASDPCLSLTDLVSRPTFSTSACTVAKNALLVQTGYSNLTTSGGGASSLVNYPQESLGVGVANRVEFDLNPPSIERISGSSPVNGTSDGSIGAKVLIGETSKVLYGVNVLYTLPVGDAPFTTSGTGVLANVNGSLTLSPALGLFGSVGYNAQSAGTPSQLSRYHDVQTSLGGSLSLPQSFDVFVEGFNVSSSDPGSGGNFGFDTGFQKDIGSRLQLDAEYFDYLTVHAGTHQHSIGFGAAYLFGP